MGHQHFSPETSDRKIAAAFMVNMALSVVQVAAGILSGSLALIADAMHNFSDAISIGITYVAGRIARRPADRVMTYGYGRAEAVAALINYTTLILISLDLAYQAVWRFFEPEPVNGKTMIVVAGVALIVDVATVFLTYAGSSRSMNIRSTFLHNIADALGSLGVMVAGGFVLLFSWTAADFVITLGIAAYILWQSVKEISNPVRLLVLAAPTELDSADVANALNEVPGVQSVHHLHLWSIDEHHIAVEAHIVVAAMPAAEMENIKGALRALAKHRFGISHATFEFEDAENGCPPPAADLIAHQSRQSGHEDR